MRNLIESRLDVIILVCLIIAFIIELLIIRNFLNLILFLILGMILFCIVLMVIDKKKKGKNMSFVEYKGDKSCIICGNNERLVVNRNEKQDFELVLCEKCIDGYKIVLKTN